MPWKGRYYYRNQRIRNRVVSEYVGVGEYAELLSALDASDRAQRRQERIAAQQERAALARPAELTAYGASVRSAVRAALQALGFHQHKRQWRMQRMTDLATTDARQRAQELYRKKTLTREECGELRRILDEHPPLAYLYGDLARQARAALERALEDKPAMLAAIDVRCNHLATQLGYDEASVLERVLIDEVVLTWFDYYRIQATYGQNTAHQFTMDAMDRWDRTLAAKQARYLRAVESLARVRRLLRLPTVQFNIAQQQIVAGHMEVDRG